MPLLCDNSAAIALSEQKTNVNNSKMVALKLAFVREAVAQRLVSTHFVPTNEQAADLLTKAIASPTLFHKLRAYLVGHTGE